MKRIIALNVAFTAAGVLLAACGSSSSTVSGNAATYPAAIPGVWTTSEISQFEAAAGNGKTTAITQCIDRAIENALTFRAAMEVATIEPPGADVTQAQVTSALQARYGASAGTALATEFFGAADAAACTS